MLRSQEDSIHLDEISVTATRSEKLLSSIPMPVSVLKSNQIQGPGLIRLQNVISEQTGLVVVPQINGLGNGIQMQGLNPDYTLILLDGEPLIGRYTGTLDLSRVSTFNIKKIEIVKGPSSSLYGSDALAGVINIITDQAYTTKLNFSTRYSSRNTLDLNMNGSYVYKKLRLNAYINRFSTNGYDLTPESFGQTVAPFHNYSFGVKAILNPNPKSELRMSYRYFKEYQKNLFQVVSGMDSIRVNGKGSVDDNNLNMAFKYFFNSKLNLSLTNYYTVYSTSTDLAQLYNPEVEFYKDYFSQKFLRPEGILNFRTSKSTKFLVGIGYIHESVESSRYGDLLERIQTSSYGFSQFELENKKWDLAIGSRIDKNSNYSTQWSPKLAVQYKISRRYHVKFSVGKGFKAPDFRQLYMNFRNEAASYSVFGTEVCQQELEALQKSGQLSQLFVSLDKVNQINAESSWAFNLGSNIKIKEGSTFDINIFRNDLSDLIETIIVATTVQQKNIYSYTNLHSVFTQGIEMNFQHKMSNILSFSLGYQYLQAYDKEMLAKIRRAEVFGRDPNTLETYLIKKSDYFGLAGRSKHQLNAKIKYTIPYLKLDAYLRLFYHSKFGINSLNGNVSGITVPNSDLNQNGVLDRYDSFVKDYYLVNLSLSKLWFNQFTTQCGAENLFNYKDPAHIPNLIGRNIFISLQYNFYKS